jgi:hypothetical protein
MLCITRSEMYLFAGSEIVHMVSKTTQDNTTWYRCEQCGLMFESQDDARDHEQNCDGEDPSYIM